MACWMRRYRADFVEIDSQLLEITPFEPSWGEVPGQTWPDRDQIRAELGLTDSNQGSLGGPSQKVFHVFWSCCICSRVLGSVWASRQLLRAGKIRLFQDNSQSHNLTTLAMVRFLPRVSHSLSCNRRGPEIQLENFTNSEFHTSLRERHQGNLQPDGYPLGMCVFTRWDEGKDAEMLRNTGAAREAK